MTEQKLFFEAIKSRLGKYQLVDKVMITLGCSEDAAYRRIRGETELSYSELIKLSEEFSVSLDSIMGINLPYRCVPFYLYNQNFFNLDSRDYRMSNDYVTAIHEAAKDDKSEVGVATNSLPLTARTEFEPLYKFFILKWMYLFSKRDKITPFSQIIIPKELTAINKQYFEEIQKIRYTYYIYQNHAMLYLINDVLYFKDIKLLSTEDVETIKSCLYASFDKVEKMIINGCNERGHKVDFYESGLNFETAYSYLSTPNIFICMIDAFSIGAVTSLHEQAAEIMRPWMQSLKRTSMLLTGSEKNRIQFLEKQHKMVDKL
jgi:hypothetical protein